MKLILSSLFVLGLALGAHSLEKARFDFYRVYEVFVQTDQQLELMKQIEEYPNGYDFWSFPTEVGRKLELVVPPHKFGEFSEFIQNFSLKTRLMINNLQEVFDNEQPKKQRKAAFDWTGYQDNDAINAWMTTIVNTHSAASSIVAGNTHEGRQIRGVRINIGGGSNKKTVIIEGTMHAREWISTACVTWMLNELLTSTDPEVQAVAAAFEWIVIPVTNPDGYVYTWTTNRQWRKTRRPQNLLCVGADPNRNWDDHHGEGGASTNPCADNYGGAAPFSEPETLSLSNYFRSLSNVVGYFAFHAYGQMIMTPFGWTTNLPANYNTLVGIGGVGRTALQSKFGTSYSLGSIANVIYIASGSSVDWVNTQLRTNLSYAYELRDTGRNGFALPADQIVDTSIETFASVIAMMREAQRLGVA